MDKQINLRSPLSRAYWCGNFRCTYKELATAVKVMDSTEPGLVGLYLASRSPTEEVGLLTQPGGARSIR